MHRGAVRSAASGALTHRQAPRRDMPALGFGRRATVRMMALEIGEWTSRVLAEGMPPLPEWLEPSAAIPIALWRGKRHGAVLFVRLWRNGTVDNECAISERAPDGSWARPGSWGGCGWIDDPLVRSATGWDGDPVAWLGCSSQGGVRAVLGAASRQVAAIAVEQDGHNWTVPIESACGAFIVGLEEPAVVRLSVLDRHGRRLADAEGNTERTI